MLKTERDGEVWAVTQPAHAAVSGRLAAHWGNDDFARPGNYAPTGDPERLRGETVLGIAEHDNGWWEWEAAPPLCNADGLPQGLIEVLRDREAGMERWRRGIPRLADAHPYAALLIERHAYWLYAPSLGAASDRAAFHPLFGGGDTSSLPEGERETTERFVKELEFIERDLRTRLAGDPTTADWLQPEHLKPHVRLLQLLDALSLSLASTMIPSLDGASRGRGEDAFDLFDVPRRTWDDRVTVQVRPLGAGRISCAPFPFDVNPLVVNVPTKIVERGDRPRGEAFATWWHRLPTTDVRYEFVASPGRR